MYRNFGILCKPLNESEFQQKSSENKINLSNLWRCLNPFLTAFMVRDESARLASKLLADETLMAKFGISGNLPYLFWLFIIIVLIKDNL